MTTRLTGGLTPGDPADPTTFPAIYNANLDELEAADATKADGAHTHTSADVGAATAPDPAQFGAGQYAVLLRDSAQPSGFRWVVANATAGGGDPLPDGALLTEAGDVLTTEAGDVLVIEGA